MVVSLKIDPAEFLRLPLQTHISYVSFLYYLICISYISYIYTVHGILQARILEWVAFPFSRGSFWPSNWTRVSCTEGRFFTNWAIRQALYCISYNLFSDEFTSVALSCPEIQQSQSSLRGRWGGKRRVIWVSMWVRVPAVSRMPFP